MKLASRFMPKYTSSDRRIDPVGWLFIIVLLFILLWFSIERPLLLILIPYMAAVTVYSNVKYRKKINALAVERSELDICDFSRSFDCKTIDTWVIRAVYEQLQDYLAYIGTAKPFPIKADDHISDDLEIDDEDLNIDICKEISQRTNRSLQNTAQNPYYEKVNTVSDLVYFFNEQPLSETS